MNDMLTAKDIQSLLQVDRSTVYRMAEAGRLPAIKVGKQWRFPAEQMHSWLQGKNTQTVQPVTSHGPHTAPAPAANDLLSLLPMDCVQLILDSFAQALDTMLVITDMDGRPISTVSNPCGLFSAIMDEPEALQRCIHTWHDLATMLSLEPQFKQSQLGLMCARSLIRVGTELKGMVVTGCIAPHQWPPTAAAVARMAADFGVAPQTISQHLDDVYMLEEQQQAKILSFLPQIADIVAHIVNERVELVGRLQAIAELTSL